jgi:hypothetical protein
MIMYRIMRFSITRDSKDGSSLLIYPPNAADLPHQSNQLWVGFEVVYDVHFHELDRYSLIVENYFMLVEQLLNQLCK